MHKTTRVLAIAVAAVCLSLFGMGCQNGEEANPGALGADHPQGEHPQGEHPEGEHPDG